MTAHHYSFAAQGTFMGVRPLFLPDGKVAGNPALIEFIRSLQSMRCQSMDAPQRIAAIDTGLEKLRRALTPNLIHHYQLINESYHVDLAAGDKTYEIELWWPKNLPNSTPDNFAKPCCGIFVMRDNLGAMHLRVGYQPGALLIDAQNPQMPLALVVHDVKKHIVTQTITDVNVNIYGEPATQNPVSQNAVIIRDDNPANNAQLDEPLKYVRDGFARNPAGIDADGLAGLLQIECTQPPVIRLRQRGAR